VVLRLTWRNDLSNSPSLSGVDSVWGPERPVAGPITHFVYCESSLSRQAMLLIHRGFQHFFLSFGSCCFIVCPSVWSTAQPRRSWGQELRATIQELS
jgi:hypothetical protein